VPNFEAWMGSNVFSIDGAARAGDAWRRIQDKPSSITLYRDEIAQAAQTVRIEFESTVINERQGEATEASERRVVLFGVRGHATQPDTDLKNGDLFMLNNQRYEVMDVVLLPGEVQARAERLT
jgi:hypothetical protein